MMEETSTWASRQLNTTKFSVSSNVKAWESNDHAETVAQIELKSLETYDYFLGMNLSYSHSIPV
jgi:hypothetical protein